MNDKRPIVAPDNRNDIRCPECGFQLLSDFRFYKFTCSCGYECSGQAVAYARSGYDPEEDSQNE